MWGVERKWCRLAEKEEQAGSEVAFTSYGIPLAPVTSLRYLGKVLLAAENDWLAVVHNLQKVRRMWARMKQVWSREGSDAPNLGQIYLEVVQ